MWWAKAMEAVQSLEAAARNAPAERTWNVQKGAMGTGETLPGLVVCGTVGATAPITSDPGKGVLCREGVGGGHSTG